MLILFPSGLSSTQSLKMLVPLWLQRAHNRPLSIALSGADIDYDVVSIIWNYAQQLKHFNIIEVDMAAEEVPLWKGTIPGPWPSLETLSITYVYGAGLSPRHILDLLRLAPNLIECTVEPHVVVDVEEMLVLPKLRRLELQTVGTRTLNCEFLNHLSLPGLESLTVYGMYNNLCSFLRRSSPPLRELVLEVECSFPVLAKCLHLVPDLRQLELWEPPVEDVFAGLAELPTLVPHLNTLVLNVDEEVIFASFWEALHRALLVRRTGFLLVRITMLEVLSNWRMPPPDIIAAFRAWAMDGIQIQLITRHNPKEWARRGHLGPWEKWNHTFA